MTKYYVFTLLLFFACVNFMDVNAQENNDEIKTLFKSKVAVNGYGAFDIRFSEIDKKSAFMLGGNGGLIFNKHFYLGIGAYGLASNLEISNVELGNLRMYTGYSGFIFGYTIAPKSLFHIYIPVLVSLAGAELYKEGSQLGEIFVDEFFVDQNTFLIVEGMVNIEINLTGFLKLSLGGGYRFADGIISPYINDDMFKSYSINFSIIGGKFY